MRRRNLLALLAGALFSPLAVMAQPKAPIIGVLDIGDPGPLLRQLREVLREFGYVEGQNIHIEVRTAERKPEILRGLADELVRLKVDVIVARLTPSVRAAKEATQTIPIVMAMAGAPLETGLIASLSRPGGNITGLSSTSAELSGKRLQLMQEMVPSLRRIAILANAADPFAKPFVAEIERAAASLGMQANAVMVTRSDEFAAAFGAMTDARADAVAMQGSLATKPAAALAMKHRIPLFSTNRDAVDAGALMSYAGRLDDGYRQAAGYVVKILNGASPADLPVEQPTRFELIINLKTAAALGLTVSPALLARADEVVE
jgi:putative tryptophan/tyrosine transport system substrate-binding protein